MAQSSLFFLAVAAVAVTAVHSCGQPDCGGQQQQPNDQQNFPLQQLFTQPPPQFQFPQQQFPQQPDPCGQPTGCGGQRQQPNDQQNIQFPQQQFPQQPAPCGQPTGCGGQQQQPNDQQNFQFPQQQPDPSFQQQPFQQQPDPSFQQQPQQPFQQQPDPSFQQQQFPQQQPQQQFPQQQQQPQQQQSSPPPELYPCWLRPIEVNSFYPSSCGATQSLSSMQTTPKITYRYANPYDNNYVVMMVDPDALARSCPTMADVKHWLLSNVSGEVLARGCGNLEQQAGVVVHKQYMPPAPPSGAHRYQIVILKQLPWIRGKPVVDYQTNQVINFDPVQFARSNMLYPVAGYEVRIDTGRPDDCSNNNNSLRG